MNVLSMYSPVSLKYVAALRGNKPKKSGEEFAYAAMRCTSPELLVCLAASNPEGRFYGFVANETEREAAEKAALSRGTFNVIFQVGSPQDVLEQIEQGASLPPMLDYLCYDESVAPAAQEQREVLFNLAQKRLNPGGLLVVTYNVSTLADGVLRFLVQELAPEMTAEQKKVFLKEIKKLGSLYLEKNPGVADTLDKAIATDSPRDFFSLFDGETASSKTFDTMVLAGARGFAYGGDANLESNFVELVVPHEAQDLIVSCRELLLYEPIKDFALNRSMRADIWVQSPRETSINPVELFGGFAYGLKQKRELVPPAFAAKGKMIDLSSPVYDKVLNLMALMPIGVGDVMAHETGAGEDPLKILEAFQILVACGFAMPMRGVQSELNMSNLAHPRLVGGFNRYLDKATLSDEDILFASQVAGCGIYYSAREAFVIQALNRVGLVESPKALFPELKRIENTPAAVTILNNDLLTDEFAHRMVIDIVGHSLSDWYALAVMEAA